MENEYITSIGLCESPSRQTQFIVGEISIVLNRSNYCDWNDSFYAAKCWVYSVCIHGRSIDMQDTEVPNWGEIV
jgi:hypothetical protein